MKQPYHPEQYWSEVAHRIDEREGRNIIAGDDEPFYRYQRRKFLQLLRSLPFKGKKVLEIGPGPGGNLLEVSRLGPASLHGADISQKMLEVAGQNLGSLAADLQKIDGSSLPYPDRFFDLVYTVTVLQHNTDEDMLRRLAAEMTRVCSGDIFIFEKITPTVSGTPLCMGRPVEWYGELFAKGGFRLTEVRYLNVPVSFVVSGAIRKIFNPRSRREGEAVTPLAAGLQRATLPFTSLLDPLIRSRRGIAMLRFSLGQ